MGLAYSLLGLYAYMLIFLLTTHNSQLTIHFSLFIFHFSLFTLHFYDAPSGLLLIMLRLSLRLCLMSVHDLKVVAIQFLAWKPVFR